MYMKERGKTRICMSRVMHCNTTEKLFTVESFLDVNLKVVNDVG